MFLSGVRSRSWSLRFYEIYGSGHRT
jgi:hypothetical protein